MGRGSRTRRLRKTGHERHVPDDRISQLPNEILLAIVSCLPLKDAVRTSVLSSHWKKLWRHTPRLNFESNDWVDYICDRHKSLLEEFRVCFRLRVSCQFMIANWIKCAIKKQVQRMELDLSDPKSLLKVDPQKLDPQKCVFPHNLFESFDSLKVLILKCLNVSGEAIEFYLTHCPSLEQLVVWGSGTLKDLEISDPSLKLKHLEIRECKGLDRLVVRNLNLKSLSVEISDIGMLVLENLPALVDVSITSTTKDFYNKVFCALGHYLPQLEVLALSGGSPKEILNVALFPELRKLKKLVLRFWADRHNNFLQLVSCIEAAPLLEVFVLELMWHHHPLKHEKHVEKVAGLRHKFLKLVKICGYSGRPSELELVKYLSQNALVLEKMVIDPRRAFERPPSVGIVTNQEMEYEQKRRLCATKQLAGEVPEHVQLMIL